jgi:hypothetical protein
MGDEGTPLRDPILADAAGYLHLPPIPDVLRRHRMFCPNSGRLNRDFTPQLNAQHFYCCDALRIAVEEQKMLSLIPAAHDAAWNLDLRMDGKLIGTMDRSADQRLFELAFANGNMEATLFKIHAYLVKPFDEKFVQRS